MDAHRLIVADVVEQHVEEAATLADLRRQYLHAPHVNLSHLARLDERLTAHLDGVAVAGEAGWRSCVESLASERAGSLFAGSVIALEARDDQRLNTLLALAEALPEARPGFLGALGWVPAESLRHVGNQLLSSANPFLRYAGIVGCSMQGLDPGLILANAVKSPEPLLRARALRAAGEIGRTDLLSVCAAGVQGGDAVCRFWAAWSAVRLGDRGAALEAMLDMYRTPDPGAPRSASLVLLALELPRAHALLTDIARDPARMRDLIEGAGQVGDIIYVPWLIEQMAQEPFSRIAGEAFTMITGADLEDLDLERDPPEEPAEGPNDDPEDDNVAMDRDEGLPWPDPVKVSEWWRENKARFTNGVRTFMGAPLSSESCHNVLKVGYQRQRRTAALHRGLQNPDTVLFDCRSLASLQRRRLG